VTATVPGIEVALAEADEARGITRGRRTAVVGGSEVELEVIRGAPAPGVQITGPAVVELPESTLLVPPEWSGEVDPTGTIRLNRLAPIQLENRPGGDSPGVGR
jgi:N-methylhydantoinase A